MADKSERLVELRPLVHLPAEAEIEAVIYQSRWVDGIKKDALLVSDKEIAKAIIKLLKDE